MKTDREAQAFRAAYDQLVEPTPQAPAWEELMDTASKPRATETERVPKYRRPIAIVATSALLVALVIGGLALFGPLGGTEDIELIDEPTVTTTEPITEKTVATTGTSLTTTTAPVSVAPPVIPPLGEGWEIVLSNRPGDPLFLEPGLVFPTGAGYFVEFLDPETYENHPYLVRLDDDEPILIESIAAGSLGGPAHGFVTGRPGVVAWANVGPESQTEAQLWVSTNGIDFERVAENLLAGCTGVPGCQGSSIYAAAASPAGRVVALAYDPLVWNGECDNCFDLNPVALVSDNGYQWTRQPLDLLNVLPAEWQGEADIRSPLVFVDGRWLTYGTRYYNSGHTTDTALFASENGIDWQLVDTGDLFDETYLMGIAANDRGVVAITRGDAYWSAGGYDWTRTTVTDRDNVGSVAAYDNGYIAVSSPMVPAGAPLDTIWYSADGTTWSRMPLELEEPTNWNAIVGDGPNLVAVGVTNTNLKGIWRWSE